jgi:hypothetical protein
MNASIELSDQEIADLRELTNESEPNRAVRIAMAEYLRYARRMRLKAISGQVTMEDNWRHLESAEGETID